MILMTYERIVARTIKFATITINYIYVYRNFPDKSIDHFTINIPHLYCLVVLSECPWEVFQCLLNNIFQSFPFFGSFSFLRTPL